MNPLCSTRLAIALALLAAGCTTSHDIFDDAGSGPDAPPDSGRDALPVDGPPPDRPPVDAPPDRDAPPDAPLDGGPHTPVGEPCTSDADCESGLCLTADSGFPGGYCTEACGRGAECPAGATCTPIGSGTRLCLRDCDPFADERECRPGYACARSFRLPAPVCVPGCTDDEDCPAGSVCDPDEGFAGTCYSSDVDLGDACSGRSDCPADAFCLAEEIAGWPGGACLGYGCDVELGTGCAGDAACLPTERGDSVCVDGCTSDSDCRTGYRCLASEAYPDRTYCGPGCTDDSSCSDGRVCYPPAGTCTEPFEPTDLGQACSTRPEICVGGTCLFEFWSGFPGSYCTYVGCDAVTGDGCPGDGVCLGTEDGTTLCLDGCETDAHCRAGYACAPSDRADPTSPLACIPACSMDSVCANDGFECNDGTGLCTEPFDPDLSGVACTEALDCLGGLCLPDGDGWPEGMCLFPGCRLSGEGGSEPCPAGSHCVDDGSGDPTIGVCGIDCAPATLGDCREGYACSPTDADPLLGTCIPACESDADCAPSTCDLVTGLCATS